MSSKEIQLTQAIIDENDDKVNELIKESNIKEWINKQVSKNELENHCLPDSFEWTTAIGEACSDSTFTIMQQIVDAGANLYNINSDCHSALTWACVCKTNTLPKVKFLLNKDGELLQATTNIGFSALHCAAQAGQVEVCEYLLQRGAEVDAQNDEGASSMHIAARRNHSDVIKLLHNHGAKICLRDIFDDIPLMRAALYGAHDALKTLIELGSDIHTTGKWKRSTLHRSGEAGSVECCDELLQRGVSVNVRDEYNIIPLHRAALKGHTKCINFLIDHGANVNAKSVYGRTPLHSACKKGHLCAVQALASHKDCDVNLTDKKGKTAMDLAATKNHQHIVSVLSQLHFAKPIQRELSAVKNEMKALKQRDDVAQSIGAMSISDDTKSSAMELKKAVRKNMHWLVQNLEPMDHLDYLFSFEALNREEYELVRKQLTAAEKTRSMILALLDKPNDSWAPIFLESLRQGSSFAADKLLSGL